MAEVEGDALGRRAGRARRCDQPEISPARRSTLRIRPVSKSRSGSALPLELIKTFGSPSSARRNSSGSAPAASASSSRND